MTRHVAAVEGYVAAYRLPFLRALRERCDALTVVACGLDPSVGPALSAMDVGLRQVPVLMLPRTWRHPAGFAQPDPMEVPLGVGRALAGCRPTVVLSADMGGRTLQAAAYCRRSGVPLVVWARLSEHSERGRAGYQRRLRPRLARRAARVVVNGASGRRYMASIGVDPDRLRVVPQALDPVAVAGPRHGSRSPGPTRLLSVGRLVAGKGLHHLLDAWSALPRDRWSLTVVGDGEARPGLQAQADRHGLPVVFAGAQPPEELPRFYAAADFLVHPSLSDEWALVVGEALASGLPVLGSRYAQAVDELVVDGWNGWSFRPDDHAELARVLGRAAAVDGPGWDWQSGNARASATGLWPDAVAERFMAVLAEAAADEATEVPRGRG